MQRAQGELKAAEETFRKAVAMAPRSLNAHLALGNYLWSARRLDEAEHEFQQALALNPSDPLANHALATLYLVTDRVGEAEPYFKNMAANPTNRSGRLRLADYYVAISRPHDAVLVLEDVAKDQSLHGAAEVRLAAIAYAEGHHDEAHQRIGDLLKREPANPDALIVRARFLLLEDKLDDALASTRASIASDPASAPAYFTLGTIQTRRKDFEEATRAFNEILKLRPGDTAARLQLARLALTTGAADRAARLAAEVTAKTPRDASARIVLARALMAKGDFDAAEREMRPLLAGLPKSAPVQALNGSLEALRHNTTAARAAFTRALQLDADNLDALGGMVALDIAAGHINLVLNELDARLARTPDNPDLLMIAAETYTAAQDQAKAEQALRRIIEIAPMNLTAYSMLGRLYVQQRRLDEAREEFDTITRRFPKSVGAQTMAAMILEMQGRSAEAEQRYAAIVAASPRAAAAANNLAWLLCEKGGNLDQALQLAQTAKAQMPDAAEVDDTLGWIYYQKGLLDPAIRALEDAVKHDPGSALYQQHLSLAQAKRTERLRSSALNHGQY